MTFEQKIRLAYKAFAAYVDANRDAFGCQWKSEWLLGYYERLETRSDAIGYQEIYLDEDEQEDIIAIHLLGDMDAIAGDQLSKFLKIDLP